MKESIRALTMADTICRHPHAVNWLQPILMACSAFLQVTVVYCILDVIIIIIIIIIDSLVTSLELLIQLTSTIRLSVITRTSLIIKRLTLL